MDEFKRSPKYNTSAIPQTEFLNVNPGGIPFIFHKTIDELIDFEGLIGNVCLEFLHRLSDMLKRWGIKSRDGP